MCAYTLRRMGRVGKVIAVVWAVAMLLVVESIIKHPTGTKPGAPEVYAEIAASIDCWDLQAMFDRAADGPRRPWRSSYMHAANERMRELGCYG